MASIKKKGIETENESNTSSDEEKLDSNENSEEFHLCAYCGISLRKGNLSNHIRTVHNCEVEEKFIYDVSFELLNFFFKN